MIKGDVPEDYLRRFEKIKGKRQSFYDSRWQDIADYMLVSHEYMRMYTPGENRNIKIYDNTGLRANARLAASLHSFLTPPGQKWFEFAINDNVPLSHADRMWLDEATNAVLKVFRRERGGFNTAVYEFYLELCGIGNAVMMPQYRRPTLEEPSGGIYFRTYPMNDCYWIVNDKGVVDTLFRCIELSAYEAWRMFGDKTPQKIKDKLEKDSDTTFEFLHVVHPSSDLSVPSRWPYRSVYVCKEYKEDFVDIGGYQSFPYMAGRWSKRSGEDYGSGPGAEAISDVRMVNDMMEVTLRGAEKMVDPPLLMPSDTAIGPIVIDPGAIITYDPQSEPVSQLEMKGKPDIAFALIERIQSQINDTFYMSVLNMQNRPQMTATEVIEFQQQNLRQLGPVLSRLQTEFTGPLIERTFELLVNNAMLPAAPPSLQGREIKIEYTSPISQAQKQIEVDAIMRTLGVAAQLAQFGDADVLQNFDNDALVQYIGLDINSVETKVMRSPEQVMQIRQARAQQMQQMQESAMLEQQAGAMKDVSQGAKNMMAARG